MSKLQSFQMVNFAVGPKPVVELDVPQNSVFLKIILTPDGIFALYDVPDIEIESELKEVFYQVNTNTTIPANSTFVASETMFTYDDNNKPDIVLFTFFRANNAVYKSKIISLN